MTVWNMLKCNGAAVAVLFTLSGNSALAVDMGHGKDLALRWCASCHLVSNDQTTASSVSVPSFYDIAKDPDWSKSNLTAFLADPHPVMPNMTLSNQEISELTGYISSLAPAD